jgi:hypothetical protein
MNRDRRSGVVPRLAREAAYDAIFIGFVAPGTAALYAEATYCGRPGGGCGEWHPIIGANKICPSQ